MYLLKLSKEKCHILSTGYYINQAVILHTPGLHNDQLNKYDISL